MGLVLGQTICLNQDLTTHGLTMTAHKHTEIKETLMETPTVVTEGIPILVMFLTGVPGRHVAKLVIADHNQETENSTIILGHKLETVRPAYLKKDHAEIFQNVR